MFCILKVYLFQLFLDPHVYIQHKTLTLFGQLLLTWNQNGTYICMLISCDIQLIDECLIMAISTFSACLYLDAYIHDIQWCTLRFIAVFPELLLHYLNLSIMTIKLVVKYDAVESCSVVTLVLHTVHRTQFFFSNGEGISLFWCNRNMQTRWLTCQ